jgi:hypothetical protein
LGTASRGFRVDTTTTPYEWRNPASTSVERVIYRLYGDFIRGRVAGTTPTPSPLWSAAEQRITSGYDAGQTFIPAGLIPRVLRIVPTDSTRAMYCIQAVWTGTDPLKGAVETVYAVRESGHWVLLGAINVNTAAWSRVTFGPITYIYPPTHRFDSAKARAAIAFTDSLVDRFGVRSLPRLDYYLARSGDDALGLQGIDNYQKYPGVVGGMAAPGRIMEGDPSQGENYRHELVHQMLAPLTANGRTDYLVEEGVAVWLGGTKGMSYDSARRVLGAQLLAHPAVSLDSIPGTLDWSQGTVGAVLIQMVFEKRGMAGVRSLYGVGTTTGTDKAVFENVLGAPWAEIKRAWRSAATAGLP